MAVKLSPIPIREYYALLSKYLKPQWRSVLTLSLLILGSIGTQLVNPQIMRFFLDTATHGGAISTLSWAAIAFMSSALIQQTLSVTATYVGENLGWTATNALRKDLISHCLGLDLTFHKVHTPGEMIERIDEDVTSMANFFSQFAIRVLGNILIIVGVLCLLYLEDYRIGLAMTLFVMVTLTSVQFLRHNSMSYQWDARQASADLSGYIEERLAGTEDIKSNGAIPHTMRGLYQFMRIRNQKQIRANCYATTIRMAATGLYYAGVIFALLFGILITKHVEESIGTIYLYVMYTGLIYKPIMQITRQMEDFQLAGAGIQRIQELFGIKPEIRDGDSSLLTTDALSVEWQDVTFSYTRDEDRILHGITFNLKPGETLGLLGRTGSGKTTMTRILARLCDYDTGSIHIDKLELKTTRLADIRRKIGLVTQDVQLFHASVRDNVTFFDKAISDRQIEKVFTELNLWNWLKSLPEGLDTLLTAGNGLSAGEAQLLALSRVFLREPGLVIMDEASSRLDPATEKLMGEAIDTLLKGRTGIIVAHRLSTVLKVDKILILENGAVLEYGDREKLLKDPHSTFRHLVETGLEEVLA